eukprot:6939854-Lingulodinium_polyedra.AAC.1
MIQDACQECLPLTSKGRHLSQWLGVHFQHWASWCMETLQLPAACFMLSFKAKKALQKPEEPEDDWPKFEHFSMSTIGLLATLL